MSLIAITVIGHDRPGIIAEATGTLADLGVNLEDSTMTRLRGHFAMMLLCAGQVSAENVEQALSPLTADGTLQVSAREVAPEDPSAASARPYLLTVHGGDRLGIVAALTRAVADAGGNITDLTTRLSGDLYVVAAEVDLPATADEHALVDELRRIGRELEVDVAFHPQEADVL
ncbi:glycine cleavage system protein R [Phytoactinopolyspora halotolerans]|uniref:ACT domain-containing protein n=1 Tax=Phytoactinopolyspora halotolerans TaxID=1981512 RepID=A0A6L9S3Z8_9ACTN|nr:ACT domain-containing protein [Phytoactinopolyspora halotolerans]NED99766.1 ACT domain-containing protein [Phytoactinopolyspora halotolerans]